MENGCSIPHSQMRTPLISIVTRVVFGEVPCTLLTIDQRSSFNCVCSYTRKWFIGINLPLSSTVFPSNSCCFCPVGLSLL